MPGKGSLLQIRPDNNPHQYGIDGLKRMIDN
jgi:hypothetical protein